MTLAPAKHTELASATVVDDLQHAAVLVGLSKAGNTKRVYASCWRTFSAYCAANGLCAWPASPAAVAAYLSRLDTEGKTHSTCTVHRAAIGAAHRYADPPMDDPTSAGVVQLVMDGIARSRGIAPRRQAQAILTDQLELVLSTCDNTLEGIRDRAMLALWFSAMLRRSDVASLTSGCLQWHDRGVIVLIPQSKGDQKGRGQAVPLLEGDATRWLRRWQDILDADSRRKGLEIASRPLFVTIRDGVRLSAGAVAQIFQRRARRVGLSGMTGHSLRAGAATEAARQGVALIKIQRRLRHKSADTTNRYVRTVQQWDEAFDVPLRRPT